VVTRGGRRKGVRINTDDLDLAVHSSIMDDLRRLDQRFARSAAQIQPRMALS
jgi:hypothetical protein